MLTVRISPDIAAQVTRTSVDTPYKTINSLRCLANIKEAYLTLRYEHIHKPTTKTCGTGQSYSHIIQPIMAGKEEGNRSFSG